MLKYIKESLYRKKARRYTKEYPPNIELFHIGGIGEVEFANWSNPLTPRVTIDAETINFFKQFIKAGDLAIDIGANVGDLTVPMALCAESSGLVLGFDPNPYVFKILEKNASLNKDKTNIVPAPYAISKKEEEFYFISSEASFGNGAISKTKDSKHGKFICSHKVKGINLEEFLASYSSWLKKFSFIKIDTEGYDKEIIKSIGNLLDQYKPVIVVESFGAAPNEDKMELYDVVAKHGYHVYHLEDFTENSPTIKLNKREDMIHWKGTINILAIPV